MAYEIMTKDGGGSPKPAPAWQQFNKGEDKKAIFESRPKERQDEFNKGEDKKAIFESWPKERQDEYIQGRKDLLETMEQSGMPLSPYFQALKDGIIAVGKGEKTWGEVYQTTVTVSEKMQVEAGGPIADGRAPGIGGPVSFKENNMHRTGIDISNIKGDDNSLAKQEYGG